jgi:hypothetical protein
MGRQHYAVTGVSPRLQSRASSRGHRVTGFDVAQPSVGLDNFIHLDLPDAASIMSAVSKISPLHALIG